MWERLGRPSWQPNTGADWVSFYTGSARCPVWRVEDRIACSLSPNPNHLAPGDRLASRLAVISSVHAGPPLSSLYSPEIIAICSDPVCHQASVLYCRDFDLKHWFERQFHRSRSSIRAFVEEVELSEMAACSAVSTIVTGVPVLSSGRKVSSTVRASGSRVSFSGRNLCSTRLGVNSRSWESHTKLARGNARTICSDTNLVISLSTGALLFLGRFVFLPIQRSQVAKAGLPEQNGVTHFEAGDSRAQEVSSLLKTKDPAGFTIVDLLAWGALGHAIGFFVLATSSNGYDPTF